MPVLQQGRASRELCVADFCQEGAAVESLCGMGRKGKVLDFASHEALTLPSNQASQQRKKLRLGDDDGLELIPPRWYEYSLQ